MLSDLLALPPVFQSVERSVFLQAGIRLTVLREDLRHPVLGGNKAWKLKYNLERALHENCRHIVSFGGAWSNHLTALAAACRLDQLQLHAFIRGEEAPSNDRTRYWESLGAKLYYLSRSEYRLKDNDDFIGDVLRKNGIPADTLVIPEGGNNSEGRKGCRELGSLIPEKTDWVACAVGTGGTLAGIAAAADKSYRALGVMVVRSGDAPERLLESEEIHDDRYRIIKGLEEGGYGKSTPRLLEFCRDFTSGTGIPLEPVYTGKLFFALENLAEQGFFGRGSEVVALHTGGLLTL
ncbi:MAG: hypothetical protein RL213_1357 [Bacteroidota bacterium]|jgi:1-aminocyclopropane-1-carboxylate deaminase